MSVLWILLGGYLIVSAVCTLVLYSACVVAHRASHRQNRQLRPEQHEPTSTVGRLVAKSGGRSRLVVRS